MITAVYLLYSLGQMVIKIMLFFFSYISSNFLRPPSALHFEYHYFAGLRWLRLR